MKSASVFHVMNCKFLNLAKQKITALNAKILIQRLNNNYLSCSNHNLETQNLYSLNAEYISMNFK